MKLIKLSSECSGKIYFYASELDIGEYSRTGLYTNLKNVVKIITERNCVGLYKEDIQLSPYETIIWELEFEKLEDLIELVPEEFL